MKDATPAIPHTECRTALGNRTWDDPRSGMSATSRARSTEPRAGSVKASGCPSVLVNQTAEDVDAFNPISNRQGGHREAIYTATAPFARLRPGRELSSRRRHENDVVHRQIAGAVEVAGRQPG